MASREKSAEQLNDYAKQNAEVRITFKNCSHFSYFSKSRVNLIIKYIQMLNE